MRRGRRKGGNKDKVFGCDLQEHLSSTAQEIPQVLRSCGEFIEEYGIVDGIYRLSGVSSNTQKLRCEFDTEGTPDLYKDVYLQDIHCVSSLCKAYFRELPNPLLTYELYDRFADAVAVQLEDERLVKIKEVLKDLPAPHYRTLEYLMHHLVKMSTYASQTNMHSRNLAIVWAPNLLRSKDIESTGFNGTAAFMEVRVQSIVVEFILTHVAELFPAPELVRERRKSLPSPALLTNQGDQFFKSLPLHCSGNLSPGDGPPPMRPYHAIIDGTDKRKGSLKGRKWRSIFNLGGKLHDPRKKSKYCPKDKEKTSLRPAKSMDSLSPGPYAQEDSKHPPALVLSSGNPEGVAGVSGGVSSGYAVTYRRTGGAQVSVVSGGTPGTYNRLDSGGGASGAEGSPQGVSRSPGMNRKADRRAGIHISGPFSVTVPLHITSGLALGVLHGGWTEKEQPMQGDAEEDQPETEEDEGTGLEVKGAEPDRMSTDGRKTEDDDDVKESGGGMECQVDCGMTTLEITKEEVEEEMEEEEEGGAPSTEEAVKVDVTQDQGSVTGNAEDLQPQNQEETAEGDYMDMRGHLHQHLSAQRDEFTEIPIDVQDAFGFLDLMDSCASNQLEFSVEPPFEGEVEEDDESTNTSSPLPTRSNDLEMPAGDLSTSPFAHKPLPGKSHSLPYKSRPFMPALSLSSDEEYSLDEDDDDDDSDKGSEYEDMFCQSLPSSRDFQGLSWINSETTAVTSAGKDVDAPSSNQSECLDEPQIILPPTNVKDVQSISQSEDSDSPVVTDSVVTGADALDQLGNEEPLSGDSKMEHEENEEKEVESKSEDVNENDTHTVMDDDSLDSAEDTYFGPDPIPSSPEPIQAETANVSAHEPISIQFSFVEAQQILDTEGFQDNTVSVIITIDEVTTTDSTSLATQDEAKTNQPSDEEIMIFHERKISESEEKIREPEEGEAEEEEKCDQTVEAEEKISEPAQIKTAENEEPWRERGENPEEDVQEMKECVNDVNETAEDKQDQQEEPARDESVEKVEHEGAATENSLEETETEKESNEGSIEGNEEETNVNTDSHHESSAHVAEGNVSWKEITDETVEDKERISCGDDHDGSTLTCGTVSCGKMEKREREEQGNEESSIISDEELPQRAEHSHTPEEERETSTSTHAPRKTPIKHQVKAVPVVPPKPQNSKLTALTLRKQLQHRDTEIQHRLSQFMDTEHDDKEPQHRDQCVKQNEAEEQHKDQCVKQSETEEQNRGQCVEQNEAEEQHKDQCVKQSEIEEHNRGQCVKQNEAEEQHKDQCVKQSETEEHHIDQCVKQSETEEQHRDQGVKKNKAEEQHRDQGVKKNKAEEQNRDQGVKKNKAEEQNRDQGVKKNKAKEQHRDQGVKESETEEHHRDQGVKKNKAEEQHRDQGVKESETEEQHRDQGVKESETEEQHRDQGVKESKTEEHHKDQCLKQEVSEQQHREEEHKDGNKQIENKKQAEQVEETVESGEKQFSETNVDGTSQEDRKKQEREALRDSLGTWDAGRVSGKDLHREGELKRNSGISICFDEAVARATVKRNRDRESSDRLSGVQWERAGKMN